jgi:hypothetical protein
VSAYFVWRSFYMMRIPGNLEDSIKAGSNQDDDDHLVPSPDAIPSPVNVPEPVAVGQK